MTNMSVKGSAQTADWGYQIHLDLQIYICLLSEFMNDIFFLRFLILHQYICQGSLKTVEYHIILETSVYNSE